MHFVDVLKDRIEKVKTYDTEIKEFTKKEKAKKKTRLADSNLEEFF